VSADPRHALGARGERAAVKALKRAGYRIRDRNYRTRSGEVDVIAEHGDIVVFVEVKTRSDDAYGAPHEAVNPRKQQRVRRAAQRYLLEKDLRDRPCRFDVVSIVWRDGQRKPDVEIIPDAFRA